MVHLASKGLESPGQTAPARGREALSCYRVLALIDPPTHQESPDLTSSHPRPPEEGERLREPYLVMRHQ